MPSFASWVVLFVLVVSRAGVATFCTEEAAQLDPGPPEMLVADLSMPTSLYKVAPEDVLQVRTRATQELIGLLTAGNPPQSLQGVTVLPHFPQLISDPRAVHFHPETASFTIDLRYVPEYMHKHVRSVEKLVRKPPSMGGPFVDILGIIDRATIDPESPSQEVKRKLMASLGDYTAWTNRKSIEKSESLADPGKPRQFFRNENGTQAIGHTLNDKNEIIRRETLAVVEEGGIKRLVAVNEVRKADGTFRAEANRFCLSCHFISANGGSIVTKLPNTQVVKGRSPNLQPLAEKDIVRFAGH